MQNFTDAKGVTAHQPSCEDGLHVLLLLMMVPDDHCCRKPQSCQEVDTFLLKLTVIPKRPCDCLNGFLEVLCPSHPHGHAAVVPASSSSEVSSFPQKLRHLDSVCRSGLPWCWCPVQQNGSGLRPALVSYKLKMPDGYSWAFRQGGARCRSSACKPFVPLSKLVMTEKRCGSIIVMRQDEVSQQSKPRMSSELMCGRNPGSKFTALYQLVSACLSLDTYS